MLRLQAAQPQQMLQGRSKVLQEISRQLNGTKPVFLSLVSVIDIPLSNGDSLFGFPQYSHVARVLSGQGKLVVQILTKTGEPVTRFKTFGSSKKEIEELVRWVKEVCPVKPAKHKPKPRK